jgi:hypothetical protein
MEHDVLIYTLLYKQRQYQRDKNTPKIFCGQIGIHFYTGYIGYSAIDPYVKPFSPPDPPEITDLTGTPVLIDKEEIQTE